jgi:hypothetical protein
MATNLSGAIFWFLSYIKATAVTREDEGPERQRRGTWPETVPDSTGNYRAVPGLLPASGN